MALEKSTFRIFPSPLSLFLIVLLTMVLVCKRKVHRGRKQRNLGEENAVNSEEVVLCPTNFVYQNFSIYSFVAPTINRKLFYFS